ncbi:MAG: UbiA prenyltransferase family protein [Sporocytophaga sp.]|nr:UbiA prenyltransferase family protein [Sporocytophaga sp.]
MIQKSTLIHLRIPFSIFLMPFFIFALSQSPNPNIPYLILSFIIIHLFFYPSSNGYNSYFDKDEESIGGIENPPPVSKELYFTSLLFEFIAIGLSFIIGWQFALMVFIIAMASKAYSHPSTRLKKYPIGGLLVVSFFQGLWTYLMSYLAINGLTYSDVNFYDLILPASLCTLILLGSYPMTQVYQHNEDGRRGDQTFSRMLGIRGTFIWTALVFTIGSGGFVYYFIAKNLLVALYAFPLFMMPTLVYFLLWFIRVLKDENAANFKSTMTLNMLSSLGFIAFFIFLTVLKYT